MRHDHYCPSWKLLVRTSKFRTTKGAEASKIKTRAIEKMCRLFVAAYLAFGLCFQTTIFSF